MNNTIVARRSPAIPTLWDLFHEDTQFGFILRCDSQFVHDNFKITYQPSCVPVMKKLGRDNIDKAIVFLKGEIPMAITQRRAKEITVEVPHSSMPA